MLRPGRQPSDRDRPARRRSDPGRTSPWRARAGRARRRAKRTDGRSSPRGHRAPRRSRRSSRRRDRQPPRAPWRRRRSGIRRTSTDGAFLIDNRFWNLNQRMVSTAVEGGPAMTIASMSIWFRPARVDRYGSQRRDLPQNAPQAGASGNKPGIQREARVAGKARRKAARGLSEISTPWSSNAETTRRACRSPVPTTPGASERGSSPR